MHDTNTSAELWPPPSQMLDFEAFQTFLKAHPEIVVKPDSPTWRINGEIVLVLGWGRAVLMQVAHPAVGEGVAAHSDVTRSTVAKVKRFERTLTRMLEMTFGTPEQVWKAGFRIDTIHARVNGTLPDDHATRYSARDPELLKWVSATFTDSMLKTYELFVAPLSLAERDQYVYQTSIAAPLLGAPFGYFPSTYDELQNYIEETVQSGILQVGPAARQLGDYVLEGLPIPILFGVNWYARLPVAGLLPPPLRDMYGLKWNGFKARLLHSTAWLYRHIHRFLPASLRRWPIARQTETRFQKN